jgi:hypothetical protein
MSEECASQHACRCRAGRRGSAAQTQWRIGRVEISALSACAQDHRDLQSITAILLPRIDVDSPVPRSTGHTIAQVREFSGKAFGGWEWWPCKRCSDGERVRGVHCAQCVRAARAAGSPGVAMLPRLRCLRRLSAGHHVGMGGEARLERTQPGLVSSAATNLRHQEASRGIATLLRSGRPRELP